MADITPPGATGRKTRGADTSTAAAPGTDLVPPVDPVPSTTIAETGTAPLVADPAMKPVVIGAADVPVEAGGPGAGALQTARETTAVETRPLERIDEAPLSAGERAELEQLRSRVGIGRGIGLDAAAVPGLRLARVTTTVRRDGVTYTPAGENRDVLLDFAGYTELVAIGAITDTPWHHLEPVGES